METKTEKTPLLRSEIYDFFVISCLLLLESKLSQRSQRITVLSELRPHCGKTTLFELKNKVARGEGRWKMEDGRRKMEEGRWKMEDGRCVDLSYCKNVFLGRSPVFFQMKR